MLRSKALTAICGAILVSGCATVGPQPSALLSPPPLARSYMVTGETAQTLAVSDEMARLGVTSVAYAAIRGGKIDPTTVLGVNPAGTGKPLLFQAASISKPVAALGILRLAETRGLDIDADVNSYLKTWKVDYTGFAGGKPVSLRQLLSHTAGFNVHGFPGYAPSETIPDTAGVLSGRGNTDAVKLVQAPGKEFSYSGGGYTIAQLVVEDLTGQRFEDYIAAAVLAPLGMTDSHYHSDPGGLFAPTSGPDGKALDAPYHRYPEKAAAGLWTTPHDLARFLLAVDRIAAGERPDLLSPTLAKALFALPDGSPDGYALGFSVNRAPGMEVIGHSGSNFGYKSVMYLDRVTDNGFVAMTGSEGGYPLLDAMARGYAQSVGLQYLAPETITPAAQDPALMAKLAGTWKLTIESMPDQTMRLAPQGLDRIAVTETDGSQFLLYAVGPMRFVAPERRVGVDISFDAQGRPHGMVGGSFPLEKTD